MSGAPLPTVIPEPFANGADPSFITIPPDTTTDPGRASFRLGFPPLTMQPVPSGGKPPFGQDVNGVMNVATAHEYFNQAGQIFPWNTTVAAAIGGYAVGAKVISSDGKTVWVNTVDANSTNPDSGSAAGWQPAYSVGNSALTGLTGGTVTLTAAQARFAYLFLSGTLVSNLTIVVPSWSFVTWLISNQTTGAFTTTIRTAATGGAGVTAPQGGPGNPLGVYTDGTNVWPTVTPLSVPISQGADPLTLAERDNLGRVVAVDFVASSAPNNFGVVNTFYDDGDGTIRKMVLATFEASLALSAIGGQVTAAQTPLAAVIQYVANILASAALTGTPTTPTAASNTRTTQVASTAFANPAANLTMPGSFQLASGHIVNYGTANPAGGSVTVTLDHPYSSASSYVVLAINVSSGATQAWIDTTGKTASQFVLHNSGGSSFYAAIGF